MHKSWILAIVVTACAAPAVPSASPAASVGHDQCARVDPSFETVMLAGRWRDRDVFVLIDTGATGGSISPSLVKELTPRPGETARYAGASGELRDAPVYDIDRLQLGDVTLAPFRAHAMDMMEGNYDLAIGLENLAPYVVDFHLDENWFCLRDRMPADVRAEWLRPMPLVERKGEVFDISVDATIAGRPMPAMTFDTGAGVSTINQDLLASIPNRRLGNKVQSLDGSGVVKDEYYVQVPELCTFGVCEPRQILMPGEDLSKLVGHHQSGIVGVPFMRRHRVVLDFPGKRMAIAP